jgi:hypothetical protein
MIACGIFQRFYRFWGKKRSRNGFSRLFVGYVFQGMQGGRQAPSSHAAYSNGATSGSLTPSPNIQFLIGRRSPVA